MYQEMKKSTKNLLLLFVFVCITPVMIAQKSDVFDLKKAYQEAKQKGIVNTDIEGYVGYLQHEYNSKQHQHNSSSVNNMGTIHKSYMNSAAIPNSPQNTYCPNAGFEQYNFTNWTGGFGSVSAGPTNSPFPNYNQTSATIVNPAGNNTSLINTANYHTIMTTPATNSVYPACVGYDSIACKRIGTQIVSEIPVVSPNGGVASVRLNGALASYRASKLAYNLSLNPNNKSFSVSYAIVVSTYSSSPHLPNEQPYFSVKITDQNGTLVPGCSQYTVTADTAMFNPNSPSYDPSWSQSVFTNAGDNIYYRKWSTYAFDFSNYPTITSVNVEFYVGGCSASGHYGYAYVDAECGQGGALASFCAGSSVAVLTAPADFSTYQWTGPSGPIAAIDGGNTATATVSPVSAGQVFTCNVTAPNGCASSFQSTVSVTTISITGVSSNPSCASGNSGSANVSATGSSSGYNYQWLNSSGTTVGSSQTATGLAPGSYSVIVSSPLCGSATTTVSVGTSPAVYYTLNSIYCGNVAWITNTGGGSNHRWYTASPVALIPSANTATLTVNSPVNGAGYFLVYTNSSGCSDSIKYTLNLLQIGNINVSNIKNTCVGSNNASAIINLQTLSAPVYNYTVTGSGGFNSVLANTNFLRDTVNNLSIGTYSASVFDGLCLYNTTFTVNPFVYSYTLTASTNTVCTTGTTTLSVNFGNTTPASCGLSTTGGCTTPNLVQIGSGTSVNGSFSYPAIYSGFYENARYQLLYTASELLAAGIQPGKISSIAFNVSALNGAVTNYPNFTIKMKCTSVTTLNSTFDNSGLTQVYFTPTTNITTGWNTYSFPTAYDWDGSSNILVDVCNDFIGTFATNASSPYTTTTFTSVRYYIDDSPTVACMTTNAATTSNRRPNVKFENCGGINPAAFTYSWIPMSGLSSSTSYTTIATPSAITVYTVIVNPTGQTNCAQAQSATAIFTPTTSPVITINGSSYKICLDSIKQIPVSVNGGDPAYTINWLTPSGGITPYSFNNQVYSLKALVPSFGTYTIAVTDQCNRHDTVTFNISVVDCAIIIPNVVTPNGDHVNDAFKINGLDNFAGSSLNVFNRWGKNVYANDDYKNDWVPNLSSGTYFYVVSISDGRKLNGFFQLFND